MGAVIRRTPCIIHTGLIHGLGDLISFIRGSRAEPAVQGLASQREGNVESLRNTQSSGGTAVSAEPQIVASG